MDEGGEVALVPGLIHEVLHNGVEVGVAPAGQLIGVRHGHFSALGPAGEGVIQIQKVKIPLHRGAGELRL